jgi:hypothetical protein
MAPNLTSGVFNIVSLMEGNPPAGVNLTRPAGQNVYLNAPVRTWKVEDEGRNTYRLSLLGKYRYTGIVGNNVMASSNPENNVAWHAIYQERQDAYTITPVHDTSQGWTAPHGPEADPRAWIELELIIVQPSHPPSFRTSQLFRFVPVLE